MKKPLDQLLLERMNGAGKHPPEWQFWLSWLPVVASLAVAAVVYDKPPAWLGFIFLVSLTGCLSVCFRTLRASRWREQLRDQVEWSVPLYLETRAHHMGMWGPDDDLHLLECHQSHMPGDCPLCGAT